MRLTPSILRVMALHSRGDPSAPKRVPFRDSKLTMLLEPTFTACNASVCVIATVSPGSHDTEHSVNTLRHVQVLCLPQQRMSRSVSLQTQPAASVVQ